MNNVRERKTIADDLELTTTMNARMLNPISPGDAERLRDFFLKADYSDHAVAKALGATGLSSADECSVGGPLQNTQEQLPLNILLRWFWFGVAQESFAIAGHVPPRITELLLECGLLYAKGRLLIPAVMIVPANDFLFVCDRRSSLAEGHSGLVLWPNPTSMMLSAFTVRRPSRATLDLGSGNGIQAVFASSHSRRVVATDLSSRAVSFAAFNARLNGVENVEFLAGDAFEPVGTSKFDLIVSNPPFFITPKTRYVFCENTLDLDHLCRKLAHQAPEHLNEGGYFQMLCEWAEISGQPWQQRIAEWLNDSGCDAIVTRIYAREPSAYARQYATSTDSAKESRADLYSSHMDFFREKQVVAIHGGVVSMRRRSAKNWLAIEDLRRVPRRPLGDSILNTFAARDFLQSHSTDDRVMAATVKLSPDVRLEQVLALEGGAWKSELLNLKLRTGFGRSIRVRPSVAEFVSRCDGNRTLGEVADEFAAGANAPSERISEEFIGVVRKLVESGLMLVLAPGQ